MQNPHCLVSGSGGFLSNLRFENIGIAGASRQDAERRKKQGTIERECALYGGLASIFIILG